RRHLRRRPAHRRRAARRRHRRRHLVRHPTAAGVDRGGRGVGSPVMARTLWLGEDPDGVTTAPPAAPRLVVSVYAGPQRAGQYRRYQLPHESVGWPERDLAPGQTLGQYVADHRRGVRRFTLWRD